MADCAWNPPDQRRDRAVGRDLSDVALLRAAMYALPAGSKATSIGARMPAFVAGPPLPVLAAVPFPAKVAMSPLEAAEAPSGSARAAVPTTRGEAEGPGLAGCSVGDCERVVGAFGSVDGVGSGNHEPTVRRHPTTRRE